MPGKRTGCPHPPSRAAVSVCFRQPSELARSVVFASFFVVPQARWSKTGDIVFDPHPTSAALGPEAAVGSLGPHRPLVAWRTGWLSVGYISEASADSPSSLRFMLPLLRQSPTTMRRRACCSLPKQTDHNSLPQIFAKVLCSPLSEAEQRALAACGCAPTQCAARTHNRTPLRALLRCRITRL